jgi:hypothetical protein
MVAIAAVQVSDQQWLLQVVLFLEHGFGDRADRYAVDVTAGGSRTTTSGNVYAVDVA